MSKAVSDDPVRNGISRLNEMMSGAVGSTLRPISFNGCLYFIVFVIDILLQIVGVTPRSSHSTLIGLFTLPLLIVSWRPG